MNKNNNPEYKPGASKAPGNADSKKKHRLFPLWAKIIAFVLVAVLVFSEVLNLMSRIQFSYEDYLGSEQAAAAIRLGETDEYMNASVLQRMGSNLVFLFAPESEKGKEIQVSKAIAELDYAKAASKMEEILSDFKGTEQERTFHVMRLGCLYSMTSDFAKAKECYDKAIEADPEDLTLRLLRAEAAIQTGDNALALDDMEKYAASGSVTPQMCAVLASLYAEKGRNDEALAYVNEALKYFDIAELYALRAQILYENDDIKGAAADARSYLNAGGTEQKMLMFTILGVEAFSNGDAENAYKYLNEVTRTGDVSADVYETLAKVTYSIGKFDEALEYCKTGLSKAEDNYLKGQFYRWQAMCYMGKNDFVTCEENLLKAMENAPEDEDLNYYLGVCYLNSDKNEEAIECFTKALSVDYLKDECMYNRAICYLYTGDTEKAAADLQDIVDRNENEDVVNRVYELLNSLQSGAAATD
ncbi:MAG: tetratricopeptide repeat protein [Parasporobacterium sp.]|nr:tetratricopeptide repeat protein [Parasporobacterium sp.]